MKDFNNLVKKLNPIPEYPLVTVRNFNLEYQDRNGLPMHRAAQIMDPVGHGDEDVIEALVQDARGRGEHVYAIIEILGEHTLEEISKITECREEVKRNETQPLYFDIGQAMIIYESEV